MRATINLFFGSEEKAKFHLRGNVMSSSRSTFAISSFIFEPRGVRQREKCPLHENHGTLRSLVKVNEPAVDSLHAPSSAIKATIPFASTISVLGEHLLLFWAIS